MVLFNPNTSPGNDASPEITASGGDVLSGNTVKLYSNNVCTAQVGSSLAAGTSTQITVSPDLPADGSYTFYATVTDPNSYVSTCSTVSVTYVLDTVNPNPPCLLYTSDAADE